MKKAHRFIFVGIIVSFLFFIIQYIFFYKRTTDLMSSNQSLIKVVQTQKYDLMRIIHVNVNSFNIQDQNIISNSNSLFLCIDYPICEACFKGITHYLNKYAKKKGIKLVALCNKLYMPLIKKKLRFDGLEAVEVDELTGDNQLPAKMTIIFKSTSGNLFYLPLPENQEINFLEIFLK